jgi:nitrate reductase assembly molybdenum cofactor insertion protein NarJ
MRAESREQKAEMLCAIARALRYPTGPPLRLEFAAEFFDETAHVGRRGLEELYTTTFDLNPVATLEVGWHLWGEQYERGRFLADLRALQASLGIDSGCELPDHLTVLLPTVAASDNENLRAHCAKAIEKILKPLEEHGNPYRHLLRAALDALGDFSDRPGRPITAAGTAALQGVTA